MSLRTIVGVGFLTRKRGGGVSTGEDLFAELVGEGGGCRAVLGEGGRSARTDGKTGFALEADDGGRQRRGKRSEKGKNEGDCHHSNWTRLLR